MKKKKKKKKKKKVKLASDFKLAIDDVRQTRVRLLP